MTKSKVTAQLNGVNGSSYQSRGHAQPGHLPACLEVLTRAFRMHNATQPPPEPRPLTPSYCTSYPLVVPQEEEEEEEEEELSLCSIHVLPLVIIIIIIINVLILVKFVVSVLQGNLFVLDPYSNTKVVAFRQSDIRIESRLLYVAPVRSSAARSEAFKAS
jgi:hypothetical protein